MRNWSFSIGSVSGIPLEIHASFLVVLLLLLAQGWLVAGTAGLGWACALVLTLILSIVLHELGHCLVARNQGIRTFSILLLPIGGIARLESIPRNPLQEILMTLAGPGVNLLIAVVLLPFATFDPYWWARAMPLSLEDLLSAALMLNLVMAAFNFLPVFPMDGGRILRALLALRLSYLGATRLAAHSGKAVALVAIALALWQWERVGIMPVILFSFVFIGGDLEYRALKRQERLVGLRVADLARRRFLRMPFEATLTHALDTLAHARPQDILVFDGDRPVGVVTLERLREAALQGRHADPLSRLMHQPIHFLQAEWPLEFVDQIVRRSGQQVFPVLLNGSFAGVIEGRSYEESIDWVQLVRRVQNYRPAFADYRKGSSNHPQGLG